MTAVMEIVETAEHCGVADKGVEVFKKKAKN